MRTALYLFFRRGWWALKGYPACRISCLLNESQWWPRQQLKSFQANKLNKLIEHCYQYVPYYRKLMNELDLKPRDIGSAADLKKLPVLSKEIVRAHWNELRAINISETNTVITATGGSTGEPMRIAKARQSGVWANMCFERGLSWGGLEPGVKCVTVTGGSLGGTNKTWRHKIVDRFSGKTNLLAYDLGRDNVHDYLNLIRRSKTQFIVGYASNIYHLACLLLESKITLNLSAVFTTAERLLPSWRQAIYEAMHCKVFSYYGCGECNSLGYQCQEGESYHIPEEHVILEVESDVGRTDILEAGQALITDLDNYAMPLLRYQNGDCIKLDDKPCNCGRSLGLISKLEGRTYEFLLSTSRELVSAGICDFILGNVYSIKEFQVRQDALNHIRLSIVLRDKLSDEENMYIRKGFRHYLGETLDVEIELVDSIPRTQAQKLQTAVNELL